MWRPLQIFLYDWWPIRSDMRLLRELGRTDVRVVCDATETAVDSSRSVLRRGTLAG